MSRHLEVNGCDASRNVLGAASVVAVCLGWVFFFLSKKYRFCSGPALQSKRAGEGSTCGCSKENSGFV